MNKGGSGGSGLGTNARNDLEPLTCGTQEPALVEPFCVFGRVVKDLGPATGVSKAYESFFYYRSTGQFSHLGLGGYLLGSYRIATASEPSSRRLTSFKTLGPSLFSDDQGSRRPHA